jgi:hypothetical protein
MIQAEIKGKTCVFTSSCTAKGRGLGGFYGQIYVWITCGRGLIPYRVRVFTWIFPCQLHVIYVSFPCRGGQKEGQKPNGVFDHSTPTSRSPPPIPQFLNRRFFGKAESVSLIWCVANDTPGKDLLGRWPEGLRLLRRG